MDSGARNLPVEITKEAGSLISTLRTSGWTLVEARYDAKTMGNWYVDLARSNLSLRLVKDRSRFFIDGPPVEELKAVGLWRAFDDLAEFQQAIINWVIGSPQV